MRFILALIIGVAIGAAAVWYYRGQDNRTSLEKTGAEIGSSIQEKLNSLNLSGDSIKQELDRTGRVIREKSQEAGKAISDATADARITTAIKAKLLREPDLSSWDISVNTTGGVVTLSGTTESADRIGKAILLALDTDGVRQVISTLQVKQK